MRKLGLGLAIVCVLSLSSCGTRLGQDELQVARQSVVQSLNGPAASDVVGATDGAGAGAFAVPGLTPAATSGADVGLPNQAAGSAGATDSGTPSTTPAARPGKAATGVNPGSATGVKVGPATGTPVKIGNIGTYSGVIGATLAGAPVMMQVWAKWTNANGGLNGHPVQLIIADDGLDPTTALTEAKRMVEQEKILAFFNNTLFLNFDSFTKYAASVNMPIIGGDGIVPGWYENPITFPQTARSPELAKAMLTFFAEKGAKRFGVVSCIEGSALCSPLVGYARDAAGAKGLEMVYQATASLTAPSYTSNCLNAKRAGAEALWLILDGASVSRFARDCIAQGYKPQYSLLALDATAPAAADPNLDGTIIASATFPSVVNSTPATRLYHQAAQVYAPKLSLDGATSAAWAAGQLMITASKHLSAAPTTAELFKGLWAIKNETLGGLTVSLTYAKGKPAVVGDCAFIVGFKDRTFSAPQGLKLSC